MQGSCDLFGSLGYPPRSFAVSSRQRRVEILKPGAPLGERMPTWHHVYGALPQDSSYEDYVYVARTVHSDE